MKPVRILLRVAAGAALVLAMPLIAAAVIVGIIGAWLLAVALSIDVEFSA